MSFLKNIKDKKNKGSQEITTIPTSPGATASTPTGSSPPSSPASPTHSFFHLNAREQHAYELLYTRVQTHTLAVTDESVLETDSLVRFLKARNFNVQAAFAMWEKWALWRVEYKPDQIALEEVQSVIDTGKVRVYGKDKDGRGVLIIKLSCHDPSNGNIHHSIKAAVYCIQQAVEQSMKAADGYITVIWDMGECGMKNMDTALFINNPGLITILQDYFPERLLQVYIINSDWLFNSFWNVIKPFLDERTRHKIRVVKDPIVLRERFNPEDLLLHYRQVVYGMSAA